MRSDTRPLQDLLDRQYAKPSGTEVESESNVAPVFLLGGAYRLGDKVVVGARIFGSGGFARNLRCSGSGRSSPWRRAPGISYAITEQLAIGLKHRIS